MNLLPQNTNVAMAFGMPTMRFCISILLRISPIFALIAIYLAFSIYNDNALPWLVTAFAWRYFRFVVFIYATLWQYINPKKPFQKSGDSKKVTIIIPTVSDHDNEELRECITTCLQNKPEAIIISTDNPERANGIEKLACSLKASSASGVNIFVKHIDVASKRKQMIRAVKQVDTPLVAFLDDHVFLPESFLCSSVPEFDDPKVGICGTIKKVRRKALLSKRRYHHPRHLCCRSQ